MISKKTLALALFGMALSSAPSLNSASLGADLPNFWGSPALTSDTTEAITSGMLARIAAKEICTCHFVRNMTLTECNVRGDIAIGPSFQLMMKVEIDEASGKAKAMPTDLAIKIAPPGGPTLTAKYDKDQPQFGCVNLD